MLLISVLCVGVLLSATAQAENYVLADTDMRITVDDTVWYVFTRENIQDNPELEELGIAYEDIQQLLYDNEAYMDAVLYYDDGSYVELFVRKRALDVGIANLSNYDDSYVSDFARGMADKNGIQDHSVYESTYKFARLEYVDPTYGFYICEFVTIVNKDNYTLTFQSNTELTEQEYSQIESIVNSIEFDVDPSLQEEDSDGDVLWKVLGGAIVGGIAGGVMAIKGKKKKVVQTTQNLTRETTVE